MDNLIHIKVLLQMKQDGRFECHLVFEISRKYTLRKQSKVQNELWKVVQKPIFPGLCVFCFLAMLPPNGEVLAKTKVHLCWLRPSKKLANAQACHVSGNQAFSFGRLWTVSYHTFTLQNNSNFCSKIGLPILDSTLLYQTPVFSK